MTKPRVRVFVLTYRRPHLLRRALRGLLAQTLVDWTCELHNDDPADDAPRAILAELAGGDPRFEYHQHPRNWGPVTTFNRVFAGGPEPLASLLEDDNWWEPEFLVTAVAALASHPDATLAWANMRIWREQADGSWTDTGRTIWSTAPATSVREFRGPEILQAFDALHSNGAMVFRPASFRKREVPTQTPFAIIEPLRERAALGPLVFIPDVLGNFAVTVSSSRASDRTEWAQSKLLCAASFFAHVPVSTPVLQAIWQARRSLQPSDTDTFFLVAWVLRQPRLISPARVRDWLHFLLSSARHPLLLLRALRFRQAHPEVWAWLSEQSRHPHSEARATITSKQHPIPCPVS